MAEATGAKKKGFKLVLGPTEIQNAATKVRKAATSFGPAQKEAADSWIKKVAADQDLRRPPDAFIQCSDRSLLYEWCR